jgi:hypothetical protein
MARELDDKQIVANGVVVVAYARDASGRFPALRDLESKGVEQRDLAKLVVHARFLASGKHLSPDKFKKERGDIWTLKVGQIRVAAFRIDNYIFLTHAFVKKAGRWPATEFERAARIRSDHLAWWHAKGTT